jgi:hypothetical protein
MQELGITEERFRSLPRHLKQACWEAGAPGLIKAGFRPGAQQQQQHNQESAAGHSPASDAAAQGLATGQDNILDSSSLASTSSSLASSGSIGSSSNSTSGPYGPYFKRQYLFIAATMPALTKADVGTALQKRFQDAVWVSGNLLHQVGAAQAGSGWDVHQPTWAGSSADWEQAALVGGGTGAGGGGGSLLYSSGSQKSGARWSCNKLQ